MTTLCSKFDGNCPFKGQTVQAGELGQTHKRTDATNYIISLASRSIKIWGAFFLLSGQGCQKCVYFWKVTSSGTLNLKWTDGCYQVYYLPHSLSRTALRVEVLQNKCNVRVPLYCTSYLEMVCWAVVIKWENSAALPCAAGVGSVVKVRTAGRHG